MGTAMTAPAHGEGYAPWFDVQDEDGLSVNELAAVTKTAMRVCATTTDVRGLSDLLVKAAGELRRELLTGVQVRQVARLVMEAGELAPAAVGDDPLAVVRRAVESNPARSAVLLHGLMFAAWRMCDERLQRFEMTRLTDAERLSREFRRVTLAGRLHLVIHKPNGRLLLAEHIGGIGLAGALLAECLLGGLVVLDLGTDTLAVPHQPGEVQTLTSAEAGRVADLVASEPPTLVPNWLSYLGQGAYKAVSNELLETGILTARGTHGRSGRAAPSNPGLADRVRTSATVLQPLDPDRFDLTDAALLALVRATGLATAARTTWWASKLTPFEQALDRLPGLPQLITHTCDAVTTAVAAAHH
jgi:hypothetical protein